MIRRIFLLLLITCASQAAWSQRVITIQDADSIFLQNNLMLLAGKYRVDGQKALILQSKVWNNPTFNAELNLYNPAKDKFFDVGQTGEKIFGVNQLIYIAGQRNKRVKLASEQARYSELEFNELLRTLKIELRSSFYAIHFAGRTIRKYDDQLGLLHDLLTAYEIQTNKGNIPLKELMRLKVVYFRLQNERAAIFVDYLENYKTLQTLIGVTDSIVPSIDTLMIAKYKMSSIEGVDVYAEAINNRPDLLLYQSLLRQTEVNRKLQKSLAYPDLHLGVTYDQAGNYIINYSAVTLAFDLPVFNRNQGNIRYAGAMVKSAAYELRNKEIEVRNDVKSAYQNLIGLEDLYMRSVSAFTNDFEILNRGYIENFQKRNISLIEFIDFFESYNDNIQQQNELKLKRIKAYEELSFSVGKELFVK